MKVYILIKKYLNGESDDVIVGVFKERDQAVKLTPLLIAIADESNCQWRRQLLSSANDYDIEEHEVIE